MNKKKILKSRLCCRVHYNDYRDFKKFKAFLNKARRKKIRKIIREAVKGIIKSFNMFAEQIERQIDSFVASNDCDTGRLLNVANENFTPLHIHDSGYTSSSDEIKFLREEMFSVVSETLKIPKDMLKPYCPVIDFAQSFKNIDKPVFENECYVTIESEE